MQILKDNCALPHGELIQLANQELNKFKTHNLQLQNNQLKA